MGPPQCRSKSPTKPPLIAIIAAILVAGCRDPEREKMQAFLKSELQATVFARMVESEFTDQKSDTNFRLSDANELVTELAAERRWKSIGTAVSSAPRRSLALYLLDANDHVRSLLIIEESHITCSDAVGNRWVAPWPRGIDWVLAEAREASAMVLPTASK